MELIFESRGLTPNPFPLLLELSLFGTPTPLIQVSPLGELSNSSMTAISLPPRTGHLTLDTSKNRTREEGELPLHGGLRGQ